MLLNLKQLYEIVGEKIPLNYDIDPQKLEQIKGYSFSNPVTVNGMLFNRAGVVYLEYSVRFILHAACDRCLVDFDREYCFDFEHVLVRSLNTDDDEYVVTVSDMLELDELAVMDVLLQLPSKMLCKDDCVGLCPHCGTDLNNNECNCNG